MTRAMKFTSKPSGAVDTEMLKPSHCEVFWVQHGATHKLDDSSTCEVQADRLTGHVDNGNPETVDPLRDSVGLNLGPTEAKLTKPGNNLGQLEPHNMLAERDYTMLHKCI